MDKNDTYKDTHRRPIDAPRRLPNYFRDDILTPEQLRANLASYVVMEPIYLEYTDLRYVKAASIYNVKGYVELGTTDLSGSTRIDDCSFNTLLICGENVAMPPWINYHEFEFLYSSPQIHTTTLIELIDDWYSNWYVPSKAEEIISLPMLFTTTNSNWAGVTSTYESGQGVIIF